MKPDPDRSKANDPTYERAVDQSTQSASGIGRDEDGPGVERRRESDREVVNREQRDTATPRRYEQPTREDDDPVMPADDSTLKTKI